MTINEIVAYLDQQFRPELQEDYDNAGFLLGSGGRRCNGVLVALDLTEAVVDEATALGFNLIVTHHPFIFTGLKRLTDSSREGRLVQRLIERGIAVYAAHTNLDNLSWGVNGALSQRLGLTDCRILRPLPQEETAGAGMVGTLPKAEKVDAFLLRVKQLLGLPTIRCSEHNGERTVSRIALCGGAGSFLIGDALRAKADLYLTADLKYHDFQRTTPQMVLADVGHYESEQFAREIIFTTISEKFSNFACRISECQHSIVRYI